jgi:hypothetical protein
LISGVAALFGCPSHGSSSRDTDITPASDSYIKQCDRMTCSFTWMLMTDVPTWGEKILLIVLPSVVEAENFSGHPPSTGNQVFHKHSQKFKHQTDCLKVKDFTMNRVNRNSLHDFTVPDRLSKLFSSI